MSSCCPGSEFIVINKDGVILDPLHSRYLSTCRALPLVTVISQSDEKGNRGRRKIISFPNHCWCNKLRVWGTTITWGNISLGKSDDKAFLRSGELKGLMKICIISFQDWLLLSVVSLFNSPHPNNTSLISAHSILRFLCFLTVYCSRWQLLTSSHHQNTALGDNQPLFIAYMSKTLIDNLQFLSGMKNENTF